MELSTKGLIVLGTITAATASLTAVAISNKSKFGKNYYNPKTLSNYRETKYQDKYAYSFGKHFVLPSEDNKEWWDKSYARLLSDKKSSPDTVSDKFKNVVSAFGKDQEKNLNKLCESYHSKTFAEININSNQNEINTVVKNFWKFCTTVEAELEMVTISNPDSSKIGGKYKNILISTEQGKNSKFWDTQEKIFFESPYQQETAQNKSLFHHLHNIKDSGSRMTLREVCLDAYSKAPNQPEEAATVLFCTISAKQSN